MVDAVERKRARVIELELEAARLRGELALDGGEPSPTGQLPKYDHAGPLQAGLSKREALLVEAERVAHLGSWTRDLRTGEIGWSGELFRILGLDPLSFKPTSEGLFAAIHVDDRERVRAATERGLASGQPEPVEFRFVRPDGELREVRMEGGLLYDATGKAAHVIATVLDITEQRRGARLLARTVAELNEAHRIAGLGSWRWDPSGLQLEWSEGMYRLLGLSTDVIPSDALFYRHVHAEDREKVRSYLEQAVTVRDLEPLEFRLLQANDNVLDVVSRAASQWSEHGNLLGFRGVIQDVTAQKLLEDRVRQAQMMEAVGTLAGGVAHDFNNYLMVIAGYTELLSEQLAPNDSAHTAVQGISEAYQRCARLTQQLLTLSHRRKARPVVVDLSALVNGVASLLRSVLGETVVLRLQLEHEGMFILADPVQVEQALMILVVNARDAMPDGGELAVRVEPDRDRATDRPLVRLSVVDSGSGIPHGLRSRIFEPFFTTKAVGHAGLGLSTVYAIARDAGASIDFLSEPGRGTTFYIDWPRSEPSAETSPKPALLDAESAAGRSILLVEDLARVRELLAGQLKRAGYRVVTAGDGAEALEILARERFDLVVSDLIMPRLGGIALAQEVRARHRGVRCLLMTGYSPEALPGSAQHIPADVLRKPFSTAELMQAVSRVLRERR